MVNQLYIEQLLNSMRQFRKIIENKSQTTPEERVATVMQYSALKFVKKNKSSTVGELALYLNLSKSSATQFIERLVKMDFIERIHDQKDRRIIHLIIKKEGEIQMIKMKKRFVNNMTKIFSQIPENDLKEFIRIQTKLIEALQKEGK